MMRPSRQHEHMLGQAHHRLHDVLDHDDGDAAIADSEDHRHHVANLGGVEARQHLIEQEKPWLDRQRPGELEALASGNGKARRRPVERRVQADRAGDVACGGQRIRPGGPRQVRADRDVFPHRQAHERLHDLERAGDAAPRQPMRGHAGDVGAVIDDAALARLQETGDDREQRGLAGAVRPDQRGDLASLGRQGRLVHGEQAAEAPGDILDTEQGLSHGYAPVFRTTGGAGRRRFRRCHAARRQRQQSARCRR